MDLGHLVYVGRHDRYTDVMHIMGFYPCKADPDVWMKDCHTHYEYVLVYVDNLMFIGKEPHSSLILLQTTMASN
jgi:hypothetical protein